ncbi:hypothetical protein D9756_006874 [Leucocoprinus leucothites]|uniref:HMG box domain-containing protein n=1 Tax=Leucocoprinus leucothites TaxID=201217 RepID=A0A8H5G2F6_9AGAR|nr:hypothetical protein D9756_006874 [Leucoagaricus leucothites]
MPPRRGHDDKSPKIHIPRPPNAFILFRSSFIRSNRVPGKVEGNHSTLSKIIGLCWKALPAQERRSWEEKARAAQAEHRTLYPDWRWTPEANALGKKRARKSRKTDGDDGAESSEPQPKRRSRAKDKGKARERDSEADEDLRVAKIADLVKEGKSGAELEHALEEWQASLADPPPTKRRISRRLADIPPSTSSAADPDDAAQPSTSSSSPHVFRRSPSDSAEDTPEPVRLTTHPINQHNPSHTPSPTPFYPALPRSAVPSPTITWAENTTPSSFPQPNYNQWWPTASSATPSAPDPAASSSPFGACYDPPAEITTEGLGYEQDTNFDRDYTESFGQISSDSQSHHDSSEASATQWTRNPGRNGLCAVISDPLRECDHSPTTSSPTTFPPSTTLPSVVDSPPVISTSPGGYFGSPEGTISTPPTTAAANAPFIASTYSSLTGWAGGYGDHGHGHHSAGMIPSSPEWFGSAGGWQGPQRASSSWGQQSDNLSHHNHKMPAYLEHHHPHSSSLRLHPPTPASSSTTVLQLSPDSNNSPNHSHSHSASS